MSGTVFARFAMGLDGLFSLFWQVLGGFWWVPIMVLTERKYTYIYEEHSDRASNKVFCMCGNLTVKVSSALLVSKSQMLYKKMIMKKERDSEVAVGTQDKFWIQAVDIV